MKVRQRAKEALAGLRQGVESVTRQARIDIESGGVDEIDPPSELDELYDLYQEVGIIRKSLNKYAADVTSPGARVTADSEQTEAYFNGGGDAPDGTPAGGFLENCAVIGGEKRQPFKPFLKLTVKNRWARGTVLSELLKAARDDPESKITGFKHIRPETVYARTYPNQNVLIEPDDDDVDGIETTPRGENAAYVQFDDNSILGRRTGGFDNRDGIPLSQNDVHKQVLDPDVGGFDATESGIFGTPITAAVASDAEEYKNIKRDRAEAIKRKAYGVWKAEFGTEFTESEVAQEVILEEWDDDEQEEWLDDADDLEPGGIIGHDGSINLDAWEPTIPDLDDELKHYVNDILAPLPTPKYATAFGDDVAQFVAERQENAYRASVKEERRYQEREWTQVMRTVAERHPDLDPTGVEVHIEPDRDESPIKSLDKEEIEKIDTYADALKKMFPAGPAAQVEPEVLRDLILQLPDADRADAMSQLADVSPDSDDDDEAGEVGRMFEEFEALRNGADD
jgi:hypothetical protein